MGRFGGIIEGRMRARSLRARTLALAGASLMLGVPSAMWVGAASAAPTTSVSLSQCTNGAVGPPMVLEQCAGATGGSSVLILNGQPNTSGYANWVSGNANGQKSHWQEGDFIPYRAVVTAAAGSHTLVIHYDTVKSGGHAVDYLGSFDATETTSTSPSTFHANYNTPCADLSGGGLMSTTDCPDNGTPPTPRGSATVPAADFAGANCSAGMTGTFTGTQTPGSFKIFGPSGSDVSTVSYVSQNVASGGGQCLTTASILFAIGGAGSQTVVLAWGGHIASSADWGAGNSATGIQGSPYHMALDSIDGTTLGNQDRALDTSAIFSPQGVNTVVRDVAGQPIASPIALGSVVHDTATLFNPSASGTATYRFFDNGTCTPGAGNVNVVSTQTVTVSAGAVPDSNPTAPLGAGSYGYMVSFGDAASVCESFQVSTGSSTVATTLHNAAGGATVTNGTHVPLDTSVYDTNVITVVPTGFTLGGTVTYSFFHTLDCSGTPTTQPGMALNTPSTGTGALPAGSYGFEATWSGDSNYSGSTSSCEPFTVDAASGPTTAPNSNPPATTATTNPPATAAIGGVTTVHTGEPFAGSKPFVAAALALGGSLLGLGLLRRRRVLSGNTAARSE